MFKDIRIKDFRLFKEQKILLGRQITVLCGRNSTGKSTILGMLANSGELKKKDGTTYTNKAFKAEFSELFKGSREYDQIGPDRFEIELCSVDGTLSDYRSFRTAWQSKDRKGGIENEDKRVPERFRVIPFKKLEDGKKTEAKFEYPIIYLGLSRLYPIGEAQDNGILTKNVQFDSEDDEKWFVDNYVKILSMHSEVTRVTNYAIGETDKKAGIGVNTETYDYRTNSSGQDNLGQILLAVLSFKRLYRNLGASWKGGLLLIDEVDATLHPAAQNRLFQLLLKESRGIGLQVVLTTHSLSLLQEVTRKTEYNDFKDDIINNIELYYFTNANRQLQIKRNSPYTEIKDDLSVESIVQSANKIKLYSEDEEARWFIKNLLPEYLMYIDLLDVTIGCQQLLSLYAADLKYFGNVLIVFDGDVKDEDFNKVSEKIRRNLGNVLRLPGNVRPEQVIYEYLLSLKAEHEYWKAGESIGFTWDYFHDNGPMSGQFGNGPEREQYKEWFKQHVQGFDSSHLMTYWARDNQQIVKQFVDNFIDSYNHISHRMFTYHIDKD